MRCEICGRILTDAAIALGYCPSCGSAIASTIVESAQRKIQLSIHEDAPTIMNTTNTQGEMEAVTLEPVPVTPAAAAHHMNGETGAAPIEDRMPQIHANTPAANALVAPQVEVRQHSNLFISILLTLIVVLVVAIVGLVVTGSVRINGFIPPFASTRAPVAAATLSPTETPTPLPTATPLPSVPTAPDGYTVFYSLDHTFGFNVPSAWTTSKPSQIGAATTYSISSANGSQFAQITQVSSPIQPANINSYLATFVQSSQGSNFQTTTSAITFTSGKNTWVRLEGSYAIGATSQNVIGLALNYQNQGYIFIYSADPPDYSTVPGTPFAEMIGSFTFLK